MDHQRFNEGPEISPAKPGQLIAERLDAGASMKGRRYLRPNAVSAVAAANIAQLQ